VCFCDQHAKSMFERHHGTVARASAFRKDDEDRFFFLQFPAQIGKRVRSAILSPHRQRVEHDCRKCAGHLGLKENVARGYREGAFAVAGNECCYKNQCVEMTAMIRGEHKRPMRRQLLTSDDREAMRDREVASDQRKTSVMRKAFKKSFLASYAAKALAWSEAGVMRGLKVPGFHQVSQRAKICCCWPTAKPTK